MPRGNGRHAHGYRTAAVFSPRWGNQHPGEADDPENAGFRGRRDGLLEVSCYCGRLITLMTPDDVANGVHPPSCGGRGCY